MSDIDVHNLAQYSLLLLRSEEISLPEVAVVPFAGVSCSLAWYIVLEVGHTNANSHAHAIVT